MHHGTEAQSLTPRAMLRAAIVFSMLLTAAAGAAESLRACSVVWPPHTVAGAEGRAEGQHTDLVVRAMRVAGYELSVDLMSWERCLKDLAAGYYAAAYSASYRPERALYAVYPELPIDELRYVAVVRKGEGRAWDARRNYAALPQPIGAPKGWSVTDDLREKSGLQIDDSASQNDQDVRKLLTGRIGSAVLEYRAAASLLEAFDPHGKLEILAEPVVPARKYFLIFGIRALGKPGAEDMAARFSRALASIEARR